MLDNTTKPASPLKPVSLKPHTEHGTWTLKELNDSIKSGETVNCIRLQRRCGNWADKDDIEFAYGLFNGYPQTSQIHILDFKECIKFCEDLGDNKGVTFYKNLWEEEKERHGDNVKYALIDGAHRNDWFERVTSNQVTFPYGARYNRLAPGELSTYIVPYGGMTFKGLEDEHRSQLYDTEFPKYIHKRWAPEQCFTHIVNTNSQSKHTPPQLRKLQGLDSSNWLHKLDQKYFEILKSGGFVNKGFWEKGAFLNFCSRVLCLVYHSNKDGLAGAPSLNDNQLDKFFKRGDSDLDEDLRISHQAYEDAGNIIDTVLDVLQHPDKPLLAASNDKKDQCDNKLIWGFTLFLLAVHNNEVHKADVIIDDLAAAKEFAKMDKYLHDNIGPDIGQKEWVSLEEDDPRRTKADGKLFKNYNAYSNSCSYSHWCGQVHVKGDVVLRYDQIIKHARERVNDYINGNEKEGTSKIFRVVRNHKTTFSEAMKTVLRKEQEQKDALIGILLSKDFEAHHKISVEHGGLTTKGNCAILDKTVHDAIHNDPEFRNMSWDELTKNKDRVESAL